MKQPKVFEPKFGLWLLVIKLGPKILTLLGKVFSLVFKTKVGLATVSFGSWTTLFSWEFALVLMVSIGIHEAGHVWAMRRCGIPTRGFYFLPFMGGAAVADSAFRTQKDHIFVALMGPVWGLGTAAVAWVVFLLTESPLWAGITAWIGALNLLNLLPVHPLDGGRVFSALLLSTESKAAFRLLIAMTAVLLVAMGAAGLMLFVLIGILGITELLVSRRQQERLKERLSTAEKMRDVFLDQLQSLSALYGIDTASLLSAFERAKEGTETNSKLLEAFDRFKEKLPPDSYPLHWKELNGEHLSISELRELLKESETMKQISPEQPSTFIFLLASSVKNIERTIAESKQQLVVPVTFRQGVDGFLWYVALVALLLSLIVSTATVDGASAALDLFKS